MRTKRKVMTVLLVLLLLVSIVPMQAGAKRDVTSMLEEAKQGVALIYAMASRGTEWVGGFGTGFAVGKAGKESDTIFKLSAYTQVRITVLWIKGLIIAVGTPSRTLRTITIRASKACVNGNLLHLSVEVP